jgi:hypothetical protein
MADIAQRRFKGRALLILELHDMRRSSRADERPTGKAVKVMYARRMFYSYEFVVTCSHDVEQPVADL